MRFLRICLQAKPQMGTMESLKFLVSSPYIRDLATLVVAYGISINLVEVTWKSKLKAQVSKILIEKLPLTTTVTTTISSKSLKILSLNAVP